MARYPPNYRREFLGTVAQRVDLTIGYPTSSRASDGFVDAADVDQVHVLPIRTLSIGRRVRLTYFPLSTLKRSFDCVVIQDKLSDPFGWLLLMLRWFGLLPVSVVVFGFGSRDSSVLERIRNWLVVRRSKMADHVLTYMQAGRDHQVSHGADPARVTVLGNATNTETLRKELLSQPFIVRSPGSANVLFIGRLVSEKGVQDLPLLADALHPRHRLRVVGDGPLMHLLTTTSGMEVVGPAVDDRDLARHLAWADLVVLPGRVGLTVVDALVAGVPVATRSRNPYGAQSPEFTLLEDGVNSMLIREPDGQRFAEAVRRLIDAGLHEVLAPGAQQSGGRLSSTTMAERYTEAVTLACNRRQR